MALNVCLNRYYESKIKINQNERTEALHVWRSLVDEILNEVKRMDARFSVRIEYTGSFYERVKTESPNEFDLMLVLDKIKPEIHGKNVVDGFSFIRVTDPESQKQWSGDSILDDKHRLNAVKMRAVFARLVNQALVKIQAKDTTKKISVKTHGPAVTLHIKTGQARYDVDLTLAIKLPSWPSTTKTWKTRARRGWPSDELLGKVYGGACHVVAKKVKGYSGPDEEFLWRFSFSEAEKTIMKSMDSGHSNSGRKRVLQILKSILSTDRQLQSVPLTSYHMKTLIFWESEKFPTADEWSLEKLDQRFLKAIERLLSYVKKKSFPHYFVNNVNIFAEFKEVHYQVISNKFETIKSDPVKYFSNQP